MNTYSELAIRSKNLEGKKIEIESILDQEIIVRDYRINNSKYGKEGSKRLDLQIEYQGETRLIFTGSGVLMEDIAKIPVEGFPFRCRIIKVAFGARNHYYKFTD
jgi:hypothetical protein